jgi:hypothetical protein
MTAVASRALSTAEQCTFLPQVRCHSACAQARSSTTMLVLVLTGTRVPPCCDHHAARQVAHGGEGGGACRAACMQQRPRLEASAARHRAHATRRYSAPHTHTAPTEGASAAVPEQQQSGRSLLRDQRCNDQKATAARTKVGEHTGACHGLQRDTSVRHTQCRLQTASHDVH